MGDEVQRKTQLMGDEVQRITVKKEMMFKG